MRKNWSRDESKKNRVLKIWLLFSGLFFGALVLFAIYLGMRFLPERAVTYDSMEDHFKYGSTRGDLVTGIPFWIWQAMPLVCADTLEHITAERLAPDYRARVAMYQSGDEAAEQRLALSREGYKAMGFIYEQDTDGQERDMPVGTSMRRSLGLNRSYINCSVCHMSTVRKSETDPGTLVLGMPANRFSLYDFEHFIFQCAKNQNFNVLALIPEIQSLGADLDLLDRKLVYPLATWAIRDTIQFLENTAGFSTRQPDWGPGRNDTFTNNKVFLFGEPWRDKIPDWWATGEVDPENIGIVDWPSTWLQGLRKTRSDGKPMQLHWDGNNNMVEERNLNASLATSALPPVIDHESIECIEQWLETLEPPKYFFEIDEKLADKGKPIYQRYCADCHGQNGRDFTGQYVGFVTPLKEIGTDPYRLNNYTEALALNMASTFAEEKRELRAHDCPGGTTYQPPASAENDKLSATTDRLAAMEAEVGTYRYKHYRKTYGYANSPLDGIWLRAPYLHNGSVPTLRDLLEPVEKRPRTFYRGNDLYDPHNLGFVSTEPVAANGRKYFLFDTSFPGNGREGHEGLKYGTELQPKEKNALLEYLKTF